MKFAALLFDCDGVLVNSEAITLGVLRDLLAERGWVMTLEECTQQFLGRLVRDNAELIAERTGKPVTQAWTDEFLNRRDAALNARLQAIDGVQEALAQLQAVYGTRMACASGADRRKIELQLNKVGLMSYFEGRCFSGYEMKQSKPAPDVYLAAAEHFGLRASDCAVIEDSAAGVKAGVASGARVFAYVAADSHPVHAMGGAEAVAHSLRAIGAHDVFYDMRELPGLLLD